MDLPPVGKQVSDKALKDYLSPQHPVDGKTPPPPMAHTNLEQAQAIARYMKSGHQAIMQLAPQETEQALQKVSNAIGLSIASIMEIARQATPHNESKAAFGALNAAMARTWRLVVALERLKNEENTLMVTYQIHICEAIGQTLETIAGKADHD